MDISSLDIQVNAVATVLKAFFADLSDPLIPASLYTELKDASGRLSFVETLLFKQTYHITLDVYTSPLLSQVSVLRVRRIRVQ